MARLLVTFIFGCFLFSCASGGGRGGSRSGDNSGSIHRGGESSKPINHKEAQAYKRALLKCYKTGGSRIVKIEGMLKCY